MILHRHNQRAALIAERDQLRESNKLLGARLEQLASEKAELAGENERLREALRGVAIMLNIELERYEQEPWAQRVRVALAQKGEPQMTVTKEQAGSDQTWRSDKAHEAICEAAESIANHYCSEDDTYHGEVKRLTVAFSNVVDRADLAPVAQPPTTGIDLEWALRELADGWIESNKCEGPRGFYRNARRVLTAVANDAAERQREADASLAGMMAAGEDATTGRLKAINIAAAIRAGKQQ